MNKKIILKSTLKMLLSSVICAAVLFLGAYIYFSGSIKSENERTEAKNYDVPYEAATPQDCGLLFEFPDKTGCLIYIEFSKTMASAVFIDDCSENETEYYGYTVDYKLEVDYQFLSSLIDRAGGIELEDENGQEILRYTGVQVVDMLSSTGETAPFRSKILSALFKSFAKNGFSKDDLIFVIQNSKTDLTIPKCFNWAGYLSEISSRAVVVN